MSLHIMQCIEKENTKSDGFFKTYKDTKVCFELKNL